MDINDVERSSNMKDVKTFSSPVVKISEKSYTILTPKNPILQKLCLKWKNFNRNSFSENIQNEETAKTDSSFEIETKQNNKANKTRELNDSDCGFQEPIKSLPVGKLNKKLSSVNKIHQSSAPLSNDSEVTFNKNKMSSNQKQLISKNVNARNYKSKFLSFSFEPSPVDTLTEVRNNENINKKKATTSENKNSTSTNLAIKENTSLFKRSSTRKGGCSQSYSFSENDKKNSDFSDGKKYFLRTSFTRNTNTSRNITCKPTNFETSLSHSRNKKVKSSDIFSANELCEIQSETFSNEHSGNVKKDKKSSSALPTKSLKADLSQKTFSTLLPNSIIPVQKRKISKNKNSKSEFVKNPVLNNSEQSRMKSSRSVNSVKSSKQIDSSKVTATSSIIKDDKNDELEILSTRRNNYLRNGNKITSSRKDIQIKKIAKYILHDWYIRHTHFGICVEGSLQKHSGADIWHSSTITDRINNHRLVTSSNSVYELAGNINKSVMNNLGFSSDITNCFEQGFPENWKTCLENVLIVTNKTNEELDNHKKMSEKKVDKLHTPRTNYSSKKMFDKSYSLTNTKNESFYKRTPKKNTRELCSPKKQMRLDSNTLPISRSGRKLCPPLAFWSGQRIFTSLNLDVTYVFDNYEKFEIEHSDKKKSGLTKSLMVPDIRKSSVDKRDSENTELPNSQFFQDKKKINGQNSSKKKDGKSKSLETKNHLSKKITEKVNKIYSQPTKKVIKEINRTNFHRKKEAKFKPSEKETKSDSTKKKICGTNSNKKKVTKCQPMRKETKSHSTKKIVDKIKVKSSFGKKVAKSKSSEKETKSCSPKKMFDLRNVTTRSESQLCQMKILPKSQTFETVEGQIVTQTPTVNEFKISSPSSKKRLLRKLTSKSVSNKQCLDRNRKSVNANTNKDLDVISFQKDTEVLLQSSDGDFKQRKMENLNKNSSVWNDKISRSTTRKITQNENQEPKSDSNPWSEKEIEKLEKIVFSLSPDLPMFWDLVASKVETHSAVECQNYYQKLKFRRSSKPTQKTVTQEKVMLTAKPGTLKRKQQLRDILEQENLNCEDNYFDFPTLKKKIPKIPEKLISNEESDETDLDVDISKITPKSKLIDNKPLSEKKTPFLGEWATSPVNRLVIDRYINVHKKKREKLRSMYNKERKKIDAGDITLCDKLRPKNTIFPQSTLKHEINEVGFDSLKLLNEEDDDNVEDYYFSDE